MKLTVRNFKGIKNLEEFEFKAITILSGTNSGGKTSLIQLLIMLKQTLENPLIDTPLILNKPYISMGKYKDMIHKNNSNEDLSIVFKFEKYELINATRLNFIFRKLNRGEVVGASLFLTFTYKSNRIQVKHYKIIWHYNDSNNDIYIQLDRVRGNKYEIVTNCSAFIGDDYNDARRNKDHIISFTPEGWISNISFNKFFPYQSEGTNYGDQYFDSLYFSPLTNILIERVLKQYLSNLSYLGPLRDEPHNYYFNDDDSRLKIGNKGEFAAHILATHATDEINFYKVAKLETENQVFLKYKGTLEEALNYWMCEIFGMAKKIKVTTIQSGTMYKIVITNQYGTKVPITHVGFGISQILPILVEGLRLKPRNTLILEQPEIHLHPKIQSLLFDFLMSLTINGVRVIVETHSDHLITRLRRRVVEDIDNNLLRNINLTFIEPGTESNEYIELDLNEMGTLDYWPEDFFDQLDQDYRAIVKAQSKKRRMLIEKANEDSE